MKKFITFTITVLIATIATSLTAEAQLPKKLKGNGVIITKNLPCAPQYSDIYVSTCIDVTVSDRRDGDIIIRTDENIMPYVEAKVVDGSFRAWMADGLTKKHLKNCKIEIEIPYGGFLRKIKISEAASVKILPAVDSENVDIELSDASNLESNKINAKSIRVSMKGGSIAVLDLDANALSLNVSGGSSISPLKAFCQTCEINSSEAGKIAGNLTTTDLKCEASGASSLNLSGVGRTVEFEVTGASRLAASNFITDHCTIVASYASYAYVNCTNSLTADSTGTSRITCTGECKTTIISDPIVKK